MSLRVAMVSVHTCPLAALGGKETGGMNVYVREVARELGRMGAEVDIFTRSQNPSIPRVVEFADGVRVVHLTAGPQAPMARERLYDHLDEFIEGVEGWRIARAAEYDLIHAHYWLSGVVGLALRARWSLPVFQMFHTLGRLKNGVARERAEWEPADRITVVPCGVDTTLFTPMLQAEARALLDLDIGPLLLYVGRIAPIKGLATLLDAVARLRSAGRPVRLLVVGGETDEPRDGHEAEVRADARRLGLEDAVAFIGAQPQEDLRAYYGAADVTVLPSHYESFGMVALEAMACASPVIASRVGGLTTTVRDGLTGYLVPEGDPVALAERIDRVLSDRDLRAGMGREGVRWAAEHRWPCVAEAICRAYASLAPGARPHLAAARCH